MPKKKGGLGIRIFFFSTLFFWASRIRVLPQKGGLYVSELLVGSLGAKGEFNALMC